MRTHTDQRFTELDGLPSRDDPELAALMEAVRRLPRDRADTVIESVLRCALGYERAGNEEFLSRLASNVLVTFRARRDPEDQKALDAAPGRRCRALISSGRGIHVLTSSRIRAITWPRSSRTP